MNQNLVILVSGKAYSGKDTVFEVLREQHPEYTVVAVPFASKLKEVYCSVFGVDPAELRDHAKKAAHRPKLIKFGQLMRAIDPHVWADHAIRAVQRLQSLHTRSVCVITDCRFVSEMYRVYEAFPEQARLIRVRARASTRLDRMGAAAAAQYLSSGAHLDISETQCDFLDSEMVMTDCPPAETIRQAAWRIDNNAGRDQLWVELMKFWGFGNSRAVPAGHTLNAAMRELARTAGPEALLALS